MNKCVSNKNILQDPKRLIESYGLLYSDDNDRYTTLMSYNPECKEMISLKDVSLQKILHSLKRNNFDDLTQRIIMRVFIFKLITFVKQKLKDSSEMLNCYDNVFQYCTPIRLPLIDTTSIDDSFTDRMHEIYYFHHYIIWKDSIIDKILTSRQIEEFVYHLDDRNHKIDLNDFSNVLRYLIVKTMMYLIEIFSPQLTNLIMDYLIYE